MNLIMVLVLSLTGFTAKAAAYQMRFSNGEFSLVGQVSVPELVEYGGAPALDYWKVEIRDMFALYEGERLRLAGEFGWGDMPLGLVCEQLGEQMGIEGLKYASTYGFVEAYGLFSLRKLDVLVVGSDGSLSIKEPGNTYNNGMICATRDLSL